MKTPLRKIALSLQMASHYDRGILRGIAAFAREHKHWSLHIEVDHQRSLPNFLRWGFDGMIADFDDSKIARAVIAVGKPVVAVGGGAGGYSASSGVPYVISDDAGIARLAAEHLLDCGLQHFAYCGYTATRVNVWSALRGKAFAARLADAGHRCEIFNAGQITDSNWQRMQRQLVTWLRNLPKPVGIMACNDWRARNVFEACRIAELHIPNDVAVIGVGSDELLCELVDPPLSSVPHHCFEIGYQAASVLEKMMRGQSPDQSRYLIPPLGLVARQSTDLLAVDHPVVATAVRLVWAEASRGLTATQLAVRVGLSRSSLDIQFKERLGRTVDQELRRVRLAYAMDLLVHSQMSLCDIARVSCLGNAEYLNALMRKHHRMTPVQYRMAHWRSTQPL
jgi:LacI family transcriptional regulator